MADTTNDESFAWRTDPVAKSRVGKFLASAPMLKAPLIRSDSSTALLRVSRNRLEGPRDHRSAHAVNRNGRLRREQAVIARPMSGGYAADEDGVLCAQSGEAHESRPYSGGRIG